MTIYTETPRLLLRELLPTDDQGMFELDSDPAVHRYLGNQPVMEIGESRAIIEMVRQQYIDHGIGRWAVEEKESGSFVGWAGLKLVTTETNGHVNFYDIGYRLIRRFWGKGFATEAALASLSYGFSVLQIPEIYASADCENIASNTILEKIGLKQIETYLYDGRPTFWYRMIKPDMV
ncbi:MAG: GNAT family N-acetyltransferase [Lewinellaceae bacterium]|nr:GNAT family N-acetyltransferase [Lewinellaceae bacterium]